MLWILSSLINPCKGRLFVMYLRVQYILPRVDLLLMGFILLGRGRGTGRDSKPGLPYIDLTATPHPPLSYAALREMENISIEVLPLGILSQKGRCRTTQLQDYMDK